MNGTLATQSRVIAFSDNWNNKLDSKKFFSTIRISNPAKFYKGNILDIKFKDKTFQAQIEGVVTKKINEFTDMELALDTGYPREQSLGIFKKFFPELDFETAKFDYILLRRIEQSELKEQELTFTKTLETMKHPNPEKKQEVMKQLSELKELYPNFAILDTETTGLNGEVIELSILKADGTVLFDELIQPIKKEIHPQALQTHGIYLNDLADKKYIWEHKNRLRQIFDNYTLVIYNSEFDLRMLKNSFDAQRHIEEEMDIDLSTLKTVCLMKLYAVWAGSPSDKAYAVNGFRTHKLTEACTQMGVDISGIRAHRALGDCEITLRLLNKMMENV